MLNPGKKAVLILILGLVLAVSEAYAVPVESDSAAADTLAERGAELMAFPIIYYSPETKLAGGAALNYMFQLAGNEGGKRPSSVMPYLIYTQMKQIICMVDLNFYWDGDKYNIYSEIGYSKFPGKFYGIGNDLKEADEEDYTPRTIGIMAKFRRRFRPGLYIGMMFGSEDARMIETEAGGLLAGGTIPGSDGGTVSNLGLFLNWDTRDNREGTTPIHNPIHTPIQNPNRRTRYRASSTRGRMDQPHSTCRQSGRFPVSRNRLRAQGKKYGAGP